MSISRSTHVVDTTTTQNSSTSIAPTHVNSQSDPRHSEALSRLCRLEATIVAAARDENLRGDSVLTWATEIGQLRRLLASNSTSQKPDSGEGSAPGSDLEAASKPSLKPLSHLHIVDRGQLEERHVAPKVSTSVSTSMRNLSMCLVAVLESLLSASQADAVSLVVPHRGMDEELRCLCRLSRGSDQLFGGSGVIRGADTLEHSCLTTGILLNMGPKALLGDRESGGGRGTSSFLELLQEGRRKARSHSPSSPTQGKGECAKLCCPIRCGPSLPALGVLTAISTTRRFGEDDENLLFDGATIAASLLSRCADYAALQTTFARGGLLSLLPPSHAPQGAAVREPRHQLVYRVAADVSRGPQALRIPAEESGTVKLREGTPVESIFSHMTRVQNSWLSAVKLNVELKRICDEKEDFINALLSRSKTEHVASKSRSAEERI